MAFSLQRVVSDGTLSVIPVSILYLDKADISVYVDDLILPDGTYTWSWSGNNVVIVPNVANASEVLIKRSTKFDAPLHDFSAGAIFQDSTIDENFLQSLYIAQESAEGATATDFYQDLNFHGYRLTKVGNAVEDDDAVPFAQYRADTLGAFQQRTLAETARNQAVAAQLASEAARDTSVSAAASTAASAAAASASASAAATSATTALGYRNEAETFKNTAGTSATNAGNSATAAAASAAAAAASAASVNDTNLVHKAGSETITGVKTFTVAPKVPAAVSNDEPVRKDQLDALNTRVVTLEADMLKRYLVRTAKTASGTSVDFSPADSTEIPSWAQRITICLEAISTNGASIVQVRLGTSSGIEATGYIQNAAFITNTNVCGLSIPVVTTGFTTAALIAGAVRTGTIVLTKLVSNVWIVSGQLYDEAQDDILFVSGRKSLSAVLDRIRITTANGTDTFDSGQVSVHIEG